MNNRYKIFAMLLFAFVFSACKDDFFDQVVNVEIPEHTPALAIASNLTNTDTILWCFVSSSIGILEQEDPEPVNDAVVKLYKNGDLFQTLPFLDEGFYGYQIDEPLANDGATYELRVAASSFDSVNAVQQMSEQVDILDATWEFEGTVDEEGARVDELIVEFKDEGGVDDFYEVKAKLTYSTDDGGQYSSEIYLDTYDPSVQYVNNGIYFTDALFDGEQTSVQFYSYYTYYDPEFMNDAKIEIQLIHLSRDRYFREVSLANYDPENPFTEPTIIHDNVENGYGIFTIDAIGDVFSIDLE